MKTKILAVVYVLIIAALVVLADFYGTNYFSFIRRIPYGDKLGHFFLMGMLSFVVNLALQTRKLVVWKFEFLLGSLLVGLIVTIEEFSQMFIGGRAFDWFDLVADFSGIIVFGEIARFARRRIQSA